MKILYFTGSGNSLYVAKSLGGELLSIPQLIKEEKYEIKANKIGVVFPNYAWNMPTVVKEYLEKAKLDTNYLFAVFTYGIYDGAMTTEIDKMALNLNYSFNYINKVKMVDNYITGFKMYKQVKNEHKKKIEEQIEVIISDINNSKEYKIKDSILNKTGNRLMKRFPHKSPHNKFTIEEHCINCSVCEKVCPVNNITMDKLTKKPKMNEHCISCFACTHNCPKNAIRFKGEKDKSRFRNSNIGLAEIISSNE